MDGSRQGGGGPVARCVLWHAPGADAPAELEARLRARGIAISSVRGPYAALAELCAAALPADAAANGDPPQRIPLSLVLVRPEALAGASAVLRCVEAFVPRAVVWDYDPGPPPRLTPTALRAAADDRGSGASPGASDNPAPQRPRPAHDRSSSPARLRLAHPGPMEPTRGTPDDMMGPGGPAGEDPLPPRQLLSPEEIAMLLDGGEPGADPRA